MKKVIFSNFSGRVLGSLGSFIFLVFLMVSFVSEANAQTKPSPPVGANFLPETEARPIVWNEIVAMQAQLPNLPVGSPNYNALSQRLTLFQEVYGNFGYGYPVSSSIIQAFTEIYGSAPIPTTPLGITTAPIVPETATGGSPEQAALYNDIVGLLTS